MKNVEIDVLKRQLAVGKPAKVPKQQHATMPKIMISKITNNINVILDTPMPDAMKVQQIKTILSNG